MKWSTKTIKFMKKLQEKFWQQKNWLKLNFRWLKKK